MNFKKIVIGILFLFGLNSCKNNYVVIEAYDDMHENTKTEITAIISNGSSLPNIGKKIFVVKSNPQLTSKNYIYYSNFYFIPPTEGIGGKVIRTYSKRELFKSIL